MGFIKKNVENLIKLPGRVVSAGEDIVKGLTGETAAQATQEAAGIQAAAQREALDYLKEREALPTEIRDRALGGLSDLYLGGAGGQEALMNLESSPIYQAIMGSQDAAEEAVLRNLAMTGGFRSGSTQRGLAETAADIKNRALLESIGGMERLAGTPTNPTAIANLMGGIGSTEAMGLTGAAQAEQTALGNLLGAGTNLAAMAFMSDTRLKDNIKFESQINGVNIYSWDWNEEASPFGLKGQGMGPIAQEVEKIAPDMVVENNGYKAINTEKFLEVMNG